MLGPIPLDFYVGTCGVTREHRLAIASPVLFASLSHKSIPLFYNINGTGIYPKFPTFQCSLAEIKSGFGGALTQEITPVASPPFEISTLFPPFQPSDDPCLIRALTTTKGDEGETQQHHHHHIRPPSFALSACISVALSRFRTLENRFTGDLDSDTELIQIAISSV
ncbi:hypothetical protein AAC387_Pa05g3864 [Persea americana]